MQEQDGCALMDILISAQLVSSYIAKREWSQFLGDIQFQDAVIRRLEIIGLATTRLSTETRQANPQIAWQELILISQNTIQKYEEVNLAYVWDIVNHDIPLLIQKLEHILP